MQAAQRVLFPCAFLAWPPIAAYAVPIVVEYEGQISETRDAPPEYVVGDRISGRLLIDPSADVYVLDATASRATYRSDLSPSFVSGFWPSTGDGFDEVFMGNEILRQGDTGPIDIFSVEDWLVTPNGPLDTARVFSLDALVRGFLDDVSLEQRFELTSADIDDPNERLSGQFRWSNLGPFPFVSFIVDKLKVTPGRCVAP